MRKVSSVHLKKKKRRRKKAKKMKYKVARVEADASPASRPLQVTTAPSKWQISLSSLPERMHANESEKRRIEREKGRE